MAETKSAGSATTQDPVVVSLGRWKKKQIRKLFRNQGKLRDEVDSCLSELKTAGVIKDSSQPVVIVVKEKPKSWGW